MAKKNESSPKPQNLPAAEDADSSALRQQESPESGSPAGLLAYWSSKYSGPIPPPDFLREYDAIVPGAASRILGWAEQQTTHRIGMEKSVTTSEMRRSWGGLAAGLLVVLTCVIGGSILVNNGHDWAGTTIATVPVVSLAGVFVYGTVSRRDERIKKAAIMMGKEPDAVQPQITSGGNV